MYRQRDVHTGAHFSAVQGRGRRRTGWRSPIHTLSERPRPKEHTLGDAIYMKFWNKHKTQLREQTSEEQLPLGGCPLERGTKGPPGAGNVQYLDPGGGCEGARVWKNQGACFSLVWFT